MKQSMPIRRLAVVSTHPIQHFVPVYMNLSKREDVELKVFFLAENGVKPYKDAGFGVNVTWDFPILDGYDYEFLEKGKIAKYFSFWEMDSKNLISVLHEFKPDAVWLNGYSYRANWRVVNWNKKQVKKVYTSDSNLSDLRKWWQKFFKRMIVRYFFKQCDVFISIGNKNANYLKYYGVQEKQIHSASYPVDMKRLLKNKQALTAKDRIQHRAYYGIPENAMVLLFSGKLISYKRPIDIVLALAELRELDIYAVFMGDGELREELLSTAEKLDISNRVKISGFVNQGEISEYMHAADILILPSEKEPFGAVVSEALPFALPVIVSDQVGSIGSSAISGINALVYKCGAITELAANIRLLYNDKRRYKKMSDASSKLIWKHDSKVMADAIVNALQ